jgi:hypothetical protein
MPESNPQTVTEGLSASKKAFRDVSPEIRDLVKTILEDEREVRHMQRRGNIHDTMVERIKRAIL